jgi:hypothetical protein
MTVFICYCNNFCSFFHLMFIYPTALCGLFRSNVSYISIQMHVWLPARYTHRNVSVYPINVIIFPMIQESHALRRRPYGIELLLGSRRWFCFSWCDYRRGMTSVANVSAVHDASIFRSELSRMTLTLHLRNVSKHYPNPHDTSAKDDPPRTYGNH